MHDRRARHGSWRVLAAAIALASLVLQQGVAPALADPASPFAVTVTGDPSPVASGAQLTYTISITNTGGAKVDSIVMTDQVNGVGTIQQPPGLPQLTISSTQGPCQQGGPNGNVVTCQIGTLGGGKSATIMIRGQVTAANGTALNNTASVTGTKSAQNFTTNASVSVLVDGGTGGGSPLPDLTLNKTGPTNATPLGSLVYTLTVNNVGTANTANVRVVDTLPAGVTFDSAETTSLFSCSPSGTTTVTVTCDGGTVNAGQNASIQINATAPDTEGTITNTAIVDPDNTIEESNELNNASATVNTTIGAPPATGELTIFKTDGVPDLDVPWDAGAGPDPVNPGQLLTYKIQVTNTAKSRADDVVITDGTQGLESASITASQVVVNGSVGNTGGCVIVAPRVRCSVRSLNAGGTITITVQGTVVTTAGTTIFNTATVTGNIKNKGVSASDSESTTVRPQVDLTITKSGDPNPVCARSWPELGDRLANPPDGLTAAGGAIPAIGLLDDPVCLGGLRYTFVVGNSGNAEATNVTVRDPLPAGVVFDSWSTTGGFTCAVSSGVVTCTGGTIPAADTRTITFLVVAPPTLGSITNTVRVDPNNAIFEPDETNNDASVSTDVVTGIDLTVWKGDDPAQDPPGGAPALGQGFDPIATSGTGTYTVIVDNVGTQDATGIKVVDTLPAGTKFLSVTSDQGFTCSHDGSPTGGKVTCVGGHLVGTESEFYDPAGSSGPTTNHDEFATIRIRFFATPFVQSAMHNEVRVDPDDTIAEANELNNLAVDDTVVTVGDAGKGAFNQLTIAKTQTSPAPGVAVATNGTLEYNLEVSNLGTDPVSEVTVKDFLPPGTRFIEAKDAVSSSAAFFCTHDGSATGGTVTCTGGDFSGSVNTIPGIPTVRNITIRMFAPNAPGPIVNNTTVDPGNVIPEGNEFDNDSHADTTVSIGGANMYNELTISKMQTDPPANVVATSSVVTYEITVTNAGTDPAFDVRMRDTLPTGFTYISAQDTVAGPDPFKFTCVPAAGNTIECTGATLSGTPNAAPGEPVSRTIEVKAYSSAVPGNYLNTAVVDPLNAIPEGNETNNSANAPTKVLVGSGFIDLTLAKCDEPPAAPDPSVPCTVDSDPVVPGGTIIYVLTARNLGSDPAFNVTVADTIPAGTTFVSAADDDPTDGSFTCSFASGVVTCSGATLDGTSDLVPGIDTTRTITVKLRAPLDNGTVTNQARIDPANAIAESNETNNQASQTTTISSKINLTLDKTGPDTAHQNDIAQYVITVHNEAVYGGGETAFNVHVRDALPIGLIPLYIQADPSNMICQILENPVNVIDCVGDMSAPGASPDSSTVTITVSVFVTADGGPLDNEACVDPTDAANPNGTIAELNEGDNCKTKTTVVLKPAPDLLVNKHADTSVATPGQTITYTVTVSNVGDATAAGPITVTDTLDTTKVDFVSATGTNGFDPCTFSDPDITCTGGGLAPGDSTTITVKATVKAGVTAPIVNMASVPDGTAFDGSAPECSGGATCANEGDADTATTNADNKAQVTTSVGGSGIDLVMQSFTDNVDPTAPGGVVTYTATVANTGTSAASGVKIRLTLPAIGVDYVSGAGSNGFLCTFLFPDIECTGSLPSGGQTVITLVTHITATAPPDTDVTITATVDPDDTIGEDDETNNELSQTTTVHASCATGCVDLVASPISASPDPVHTGDVVTFVVGVGNAGDTATGTFDIALKLANTSDFDFEPGGFTATQPSDDYSATAGATTGFDCSYLVGDTVTCTGDLNGGQGVLIILKVHVKSTASHPSLSLEVTADSGTSETEFSELNNTASTSVVIQP